MILVDPHTKLHVNITDVGFGVSQAFPLIVEGVHAPEQSTLLMEQPEIHLHPRAQVTLADLLIAITKDQRKTLIVETHSEHLITRVQRRIAEGKIDNQEVAIYYFDPGPDGTTIKEISLNKLGQFETEGLPEGFFEEGYRESMEYAKAVAAQTQKS